MKLPFRESLLAAPPVVQAILWVVLSTVFFAMMATLIKLTAQTNDPWIVVFFRNFFALVLLVPLLLRRKGSLLKTQNMRVHILRAFSGVMAMYLWFRGLGLLPIAEATAISFLAPIMASIFAVILLGEKMRLRRWSAVFIGLLGVLVILRPGVAVFNPEALILTSCTLFWGFNVALVKLASRTDDREVLVFYMVFLNTPLSFIPAFLVWEWPSTYDLGLLFMAAAVGTIAHYCFASAFKLAEATVVIPFDYMRLPFVALFGFVIFAEIPDIWTWIGAAIIAASGIYLAHREAQLGKSNHLPDVKTRSEA